MKYLIIFLTVVLFSSCSNDQDRLAGKWRLENIDYSEFFKNAPEDVREVIASKMAEELERIKGKTFFVFEEDKKFTLQAPNYLGKLVDQKGEWRMNNTGDSVFLDLEFPESYKIIEVNAENLVLQTDEMPMRILYLSKAE